MEADDCRPAAQPQHVGQESQRSLEGTELVVDRNPQGLKRPSGRIDAAWPCSRLCPTDDLGNLISPGECSCFASLDQLAGDAPAESLLAVPINEVCQFVGT